MKKLFAILLALCLTVPALAETVTTSTTPLTLQTTVESYVYSGSSAASWTLPAVSGNQGVAFVLANRAGAAAITLNRAGSDSIWKDGATATSVTINAGTTLTIRCDGTYWTVVQYTYSSLTPASFSTLTLTNPLAVLQGGTGATSAAGAATALGLGTGNSPTFSALTVTNNITAAKHVASATYVATEAQFYNSNYGTGTGLQIGSDNSASIVQGTTCVLSAIASTAAGIRLHGTYQLGWVNGAANASNPDVGLWRDAANTLALRNSTNAQNMRIYNTDNGSNDEYLQIGFTSNIAKIDTVQTGTGTQRNLTLTAPTITLSGDASVAGNITQTAGTNRQFITNRSAATDYARFMFQSGGAEKYAIGLRGDNGGSGTNHTLSITGNDTDSYPVVLNIIPGGANYTVEVGAAHKLKASGKFSLGTADALTIATDAITVTKAFHKIDTEAAAATDNLATINGGAEGDRLVLRAADTTHTVVVKDGTGNLKLAGDMSLDNSEDTIELIYDGSNWLELGRSDNGA